MAPPALPVLSRHFTPHLQFTGAFPRALLFPGTQVVEHRTTAKSSVLFWTRSQPEPQFHSPAALRMMQCPLHGHGGCTLSSASGMFAPPELPCPGLCCPTEWQGVPQQRQRQLQLPLRNMGMFQTSCSNFNLQFRAAARTQFIIIEVLIYEFIRK